MNGRLAISESFRASDLIVVLFVGVTDETVFRGWLLKCERLQNGKMAVRSAQRAAVFAVLNEGSNAMNDVGAMRLMMYRLAPK